MWILRIKDTRLRVDAAALVATKRIDLGEPDLSDEGGQTIEVKFESSADGRGFSLARCYAA